MNYHHPKSICTCGHTGDGENSQHETLFQPGHGACRYCDCKQFTWVGFTLPFSRHVERNVRREEHHE